MENKECLDIKKELEATKKSFHTEFMKYVDRVIRDFKYNNGLTTIKRNEIYDSFNYKLKCTTFIELLVEYFHENFKILDIFADSTYATTDGIIIMCTISKAFAKEMIEVFKEEK